MCGLCPERARPSPPLLALSRYFSERIKANPRPRPLFVCIVSLSFSELIPGFFLRFIADIPQE
jgi:hypothetical protein